MCNNINELVFNEEQNISTDQLTNGMCRNEKYVFKDKKKKETK